MNTRFSTVSCVLIAAGTTTVLAGPAAAVTDTACSEPTRAVCAVSDAGTDISKDRDGDYTTATKSQVVTAFWAADNNTDQQQTVHVTLALDGPGTSQDRTLVREFVMAPHEIQQGSIELFKVHPHETPAGTYTWTVTARGSETVTATSSFTVY